MKGEHKALQAKNIAAKKAAGMDYKGKPSRTGNENQPETKEGDKEGHMVTKVGNKSAPII